MTTPFETGTTSTTGRPPADGGEDGVVDGSAGLDGDEPASATAEVLLHQERLGVSTRRVDVERVRISKRIVTTTRTIEVPVRIEQLVITREPVDEPSQEPRTEQFHAPPDVSGRDDLVVVLHEEVPEVTLRVVAVERVRVGRRSASGAETLTVAVAAEAAEVTTPDVVV